MRPPRSIVVAALVYVAAGLLLAALPQGSCDDVLWPMVGLAIVSIAAAVVVWSRGR